MRCDINFQKTFDQPLKNGLCSKYFRSYKVKFTPLGFAPSAHCLIAKFYLNKYDITIT